MHNKGLIWATILKGSVLGSGRLSTMGASSWGSRIQKRIETTSKNFYSYSLRGFQTFFKAIWLLIVPCLMHQVSVLSSNNLTVTPMLQCVRASLRVFHNQFYEQFYRWKLFIYLSVVFSRQNPSYPTSCEHIVYFAWLFLLEESVGGLQTFRSSVTASSKRSLVSSIHASNLTNAFYLFWKPTSCNRTGKMVVHYALSFHEEYFRK